MKKSRKLTLFLAIGTTIVVLGEAGRADAFIKLPGPLQGLWDRSLGVITEYAGFALEKSLIKGLDELAGEFNLPDPAQLWGWLDSVADGEQDAGNAPIGAGVQAGSVTGDQAASIAKGAAASDIGGISSDATLSKEGQTAAKTLQDDVTAGADNAIQCAAEGSELNVTQDIQIQSLCIQAENTKILATMANQQVSSSIQDAVNTKMQSEILRLQTKASNMEIENLHKGAEASLGSAVSNAQLFNRPGE